VTLLSFDVDRIATDGTLVTKPMLGAAVEAARTISRLTGGEYHIWLRVDGEAVRHIATYVDGKEHPVT
jgi:hypothetical protein